MSMPNDSKGLIDTLGLKPLSSGESGYIGNIQTSDIQVIRNGWRLKANCSVYYLLDRDKPINYLHWLAPDDTQILCLGGPVDYYLFHPDSTVEQHSLGHDLSQQKLALMIPGGCWKALVMQDSAAYVKPRSDPIKGALQLITPCVLASLQVQPVPEGVVSYTGKGE